MKKTLTLFIFFAILTLPTLLHSAPVSPQKAHIVASNFLKSVGAPQITLQDITASTPFSQFYVFVGTDGKGFVIVSADDCVLPILGYSASDRFVAEAMPQHIKEWLLDYEDQILFYKNLQPAEPDQADPNSTSTDPTSAPVNTPAAEWTRLLAGAPANPPINTAVSPLITTTWNQTAPYNNLCPYDSTANQRTPTGCVATATAQVMKYWNHPTSGFGSHTYTPDGYPAQTANFSTTTYAWSSMPNALTTSSTSAQVNAVATLMYHVGVALDMDYSPSSSSASTYSNGSLGRHSADNVLRNYFKYKSSLHQVAIVDYSATEWNNMLVAELVAGRPLLYSGRDTSVGHCFVCDGCNNSGQFHFNWGWGGYCDGYYTIGNLNPAPGGTGASTSGTYNLLNVAIIGIQPNTNYGDTTTITLSTLDTAYGSVSGGGIYTGTNTTTVSLSATAAPGCRFTGWNDGYKFNPRTFYANGGNYSFVASFEPLSGDTLGYAMNNYITSLRANSGTNRWGIKLPASVLPSGNSLTKVQMYASAASNYTLRIYVGDTTPTSLVRTMTFTVADSMTGQWRTLTLPNPYLPDSTQSLWITLSCPWSSTTYPAAMSYSSGNSDAILFGSSYEPLTTWDYSFMIRGIFQYVVPTYTLSVVSSNSTMGTVTGGGTYPQDTVVTISAIPNTGYHFLYWSDDDTHAVRSITVTSDSSFTAFFAPNQYTLTVHSSDTIMGYVSAVSGTYNYNTSVTLTATPKYGYHLVQWSDGDTRASRVYTITADANLTAIFAPNQYTVTVLPNNNDMGTVTAVSGTYEYLDTVTFSAAPNHGYHFVQWSDGDTSTSRTIIVTSNLHLTAIFAYNQYAITVLSNDENMGTVSSVSGTYNYLDTLHIVATPNFGYHFVQWSDADTHASRTIVVTAHANYTAIFAPDQYTLTVICPDSTLGTVTGAGTYNYLDTAVITATPAPNCTFVYWSDLDTHAVRNIVVTEDGLFIAYFQSNSTQGITPTPSTPDYTVTTLPGNQLRIEGASGLPIAIYDLLGRPILRLPSAPNPCLLTLPHPGLYLLQISTLPARRILLP